MISGFAFRKRCWAIAVFLVFLTASAWAGETLTYPDLIDRMTNLERLSVLPLPGEKCAQCSSYDRTSRYDEATGKYIGWDANGDGSGIVRREGKRVVLAEMKGPGCLWRIWSARAEQGHVKIYLDGQESPAVDLPFINYFTGDTAPFNYPELSYDLAKTGCNGQNLYFPIPYQKSCKIVADEGWGLYYHFTYTTYPKGTRLPTFSALLAKENAAALQKTNDFFRDKLGEDPAGSRPGQASVRETILLAPGQKIRVAELTGPRAITALKVKTAFADRKDQITTLRKVTLQIAWDGQAEPAVWCPLGDFFGTAPGENLYKSLPTGMTGDGYYAYWYMPFARRATIELVNEDTSPHGIEMQIVHAPLDRPIEELGYFHAKWHRDVAAVSKDRWPDWEMLRTEGRGRFCGVMLHVWDPHGGWWGEGDEKFFVDGEKFPSTFGTGSEDYFGYAWGNPALFQRPYHCQTMTQNNKGHQSLLRWHIADNVPFDRSFEGCIEKYDHPGPGVRYACTTCWYLSPGGTDSYNVVPAAKRDGYYERPAIRCAGWDVLDFSHGGVGTQPMQDFRAGQWQNNDQLLWTDVAPGAKLFLRMPVASTGRQEVRIALTKAPDYATVQFFIDGCKAGNPVDLYSSAGVAGATVSLGVFSLTAGDHVLAVEVVGVNPMAKGEKRLVGLDCVECVPVQSP